MADFMIEHARREGDRVEHDRMGPGKIVHVIGNEITVRFDSGDEVIFLARFWSIYFGP